MSRQQTPDIMGSLMFGSSTSLKEGEHGNNKAIKQDSGKDLPQKGSDFHSEEQESNKTITLPKNKTIEQDSGKGIPEMKEKATFNLSLSSLQALEDAWFKLKRQFKGEQRITKTAIVEMALEICVREFEAKKSESMLYKKLAELRCNSKLDDDSSS